MKALNKVQLIGRLGQDPEIRYTANQTAVATISVGTKYEWTLDGTKQEKTEWHRCVAWGKLAEIIEKYAKKGRQVYVEGRLETRKWQDKTGADRYTTEIQAMQFMLLGANPDRDGEEADAPKDRPPVVSSARPPERKSFGASQLSDDDIPF